jgi:hypothetical protein
VKYLKDTPENINEECLRAFLIKGRYEVHLEVGETVYRLKYQPHGAPSHAVRVVLKSDPNAWKHLVNQLYTWGLEPKGWRRETTEEALRDAVGPPSERELRFYSYDRANHGVDATFDLYTWLHDRVEYSPKWDKYFGMWVAKTYEGEPDSWRDAFEAFVEHYAEDTECKAFGDTENVPVIDLSYNSENMLSYELLQGYFEDAENNEHVVFLASGMDWYSRPRAFLVNHDDESATFDYARGHIYCDGEPGSLPLQSVQLALGEEPLTEPEVLGGAGERGHVWFTDNACNWRRDAPDADEKNLEEMQVRVHGEDDPVMDEENEGSRKVDGWFFGHVYVDKDKVPRCPRCGGKLDLGWF